MGGSGAPQRLPADAPAPARLSGTFVRCAVTRGELLLPRRLAPGGFALCQFCPEDLLYSVAHPEAAGHCPVSCGPPWNDELSLLDPAREFEPGLSLITGGHRSLPEVEVGSHGVPPSYEGVVTRKRFHAFT